MRADDGFHLFHDVDTVARRRQNRFLRLDKQQQAGHHMFHASAGLAQFYGVPLNRGLIVRVMFQRVRKLLQRLRRLEELLRNVGDEGITDLGETDGFAHVGNQHHHKAFVEPAYDHLQPVRAGHRGHRLVRRLADQRLFGNLPHGWLPCFRSLLRLMQRGRGQAELLLAAVGTDLVHRACHGVIGDGVVPHHAKGVGVRMRAYHLVMLVDHDGGQRQYGQQRVRRVVQSIIIVAIVTMAMCQIAPPRAYGFKHVFILAHPDVPR